MLLEQDAVHERRRRVRALDQEPWPPSERNRVALLLAHLHQARKGDLTARHHAQVEAPVAQLGLKRRGRLGHQLGGDAPAVVDVWGGDERLGARRLRRPCERDRVLERRRAVVDSGQDVDVQVYHLKGLICGRSCGLPEDKATAVPPALVRARVARWLVSPILRLKRPFLGSSILTGVPVRRSRS